MIQRTASLSDWLGGGSEGWGEGIKKGWVGGVGRHIHTVAPTWAQLQQVPTTFVHERWCIGQESNVHTPVGICSGAAYPLRPNPTLQNEPHYLWKKKGEPGGGKLPNSPIIYSNLPHSKERRKKKVMYREEKNSHSLYNSGLYIIYFFTANKKYKKKKEKRKSKIPKYFDRTISAGKTKQKSSPGHSLNF